MTLRMGVVGTGYWARVVHAAGVGSHPDVELVGVWGRDLAKAAVVAEPWGAAAYDDFPSLLAEVDALTFAVPPHIQADLAVQAADAGKHLLLEKPITTDLDAADRLVEAARSVSTVVFFTGRFTDVWEEWLTEQCKARLLGGRAEWLTSMGPDSPYATSAWRKAEGALWDVGPHALSFLLPALGPVASVVGARGQGDLVHVVLTHESGSTSVMSLSMTMPELTNRISVELYGEDGFRSRPDDDRDIDAAYARALSELVANVRGGVTDHRVDVRFGRDVVEILARVQTALGI